MGWLDSVGALWAGCIVWVLCGLVAQYGCSVGWLYSMGALWAGCIVWVLCGLVV